MNRVKRQDTDEIPLEALTTALGGFELRDEGLVFDRAPGIGLAGSGPRSAICAGVDGEQRGVVVVRGRSRESVLLAIDALAWCDARRDVLARRLDADPDAATSVVLIVDDPDNATLAALATLRATDLRVFEVQIVRSARGSQAHLVELTLCDAPGADPVRGQWDAELDGSSRVLFERVREGIARIDPEARSTATARGIVWRSGAARLVELRAPQGRLEALVAGERFDLVAPGALERAFEGAVRVFLSTEERVDGGSEAAPDVPLLPTGPLLSQDELAALRGD